MSKISVVIPTFEYKGMGAEVLDYSFMKLYKQVFHDFEVVISDHSQNDEIYKLCNSWSDRLEIFYFRNTLDRGSGASNMSNAILLATGEWIKILCQDDFLFDNWALQITSDAIDKTSSDWLASAYWHTYDRNKFFKFHMPQFNDRIYVVNTIGSPSGITIRNLSYIPEMDKNLIYCYDCEWYYRLYLEWGYPDIIYQPTVANYLWEQSSTSSLELQSIIEIEENYILKKYGVK